LDRLPACQPRLPAEDHLFGDKEKFVTAAYKAKLAERAAWQEEQKRK
jgi:coiled-coil domain-containing protein 55